VLIDLMQQLILLILVNTLEKYFFIKNNKLFIYLFPEVTNQVYFLRGLNVVIFLIGPMMEEFSIKEKNTNE
jgi:hypothetical protein